MLFVAKFCESIKASIPQIIALLTQPVTQGDTSSCRLGTNALVKLSEQGKVTNFLT